MSAPLSGPEPTAAAPAGPQHWLEAALDLLPFPLFLIDPGSAAVRFANRAGRLLSLDPPAEHNGSPAGPHVTDAEGKPVPAGWLPHRRAARGERIEGEQVTWHTGNGAVSYLVFSGPVPALHGQPPLAVLTLVDVTRLKATEAELRRAVHDRDEFFSVATHELKDPLASIQLSLSLLQFLADKHGVVPAETLREQLEVGRRQTDRLNRLIENLLDVSRIANKRLQLDVEAFDLCELAADAVTRFEVPARAAGSTLTFDGAGPVIGYWDRLKLEQVLNNLITNAIKYGNGQPIELRVRADADAAVLEVADRGVGIAEEDHDRVFRRFERLSGEHRRQSLGLGLYIVRSLVEAHGGVVRLRSKPGHGATFTVELPRKRMPPRPSPGEETGPDG